MSMESAIGSRLIRECSAIVKPTWVGPGSSHIFKYWDMMWYVATLWRFSAQNSVAYSRSLPQLTPLGSRLHGDCSCLRCLWSTSIWALAKKTVCTLPNRLRINYHRYHSPWAGNHQPVFGGCPTNDTQNCSSYAYVKHHRITLKTMFTNLYSMYIYILFVYIYIQKQVWNHGWNPHKEPYEPRSWSQLAKRWATSSGSSCAMVDIVVDTMYNRDTLWSFHLVGGDWNMTGLFFHIFWEWECHHPKWRAPIFQRGWYTTNQSHMPIQSGDVPSLCEFTREYMVDYMVDA